MVVKRKIKRKISKAKLIKSGRYDPWWDSLSTRDKKKFKDQTRKYKKWHKATYGW